MQNYPTIVTQLGFKMLREIYVGPHEVIRRVGEHTGGRRPDWLIYIPNQAFIKRPNLKRGER